MKFLGQISDSQYFCPVIKEAFKAKAPSVRGGVDVDVDAKAKAPKGDVDVDGKGPYMPKFGFGSK